MIIEHAILPVIPGKEADFEASMLRAIPIMESHPKCHGVSVRRQLEDPSIYVLLVHWESYEAHMDDFRKSELFEQWRELTHPFYVEKPTVTHFRAPINN